MRRRLAPLFESDGRGKGRKWSFSHGHGEFAAISLHPVRMGQVAFEQVTVPTGDPQRILELLGVKL